MFKMTETDDQVETTPPRQRAIDILTAMLIDVSGRLPQQGQAEAFVESIIEAARCSCRPTDQGGENHGEETTKAQGRKVRG